MAIRTRVTREDYPGAVTEVTVPFSCTNYPTIQDLAFFLMGSDGASVIISGKLMSQVAKGTIETECELP